MQGFNAEILFFLAGLREGMGYGSAVVEDPHFTAWLPREFTSPTYEHVVVNVGVFCEFFFLEYVAKIVVLQTITENIRWSW